MKGLVLYGMHCQLWIWDELKALSGDLDLTFLEYPHEVTTVCHSVHELSEWVAKSAFSNGQAYDVIIGHSMGGNIALELSGLKALGIKKTILIETSIRPSAPFYHNLLTEQHQIALGERVKRMLEEERVFTTQSLKESFRNAFDYSNTLMAIDHQVIAIYGDRNQPDYPDLIRDLNLSESEMKQLELIFIEDACHMPMLENPKRLSKLLRHYIKAD